MKLIVVLVILNTAFVALAFYLHSYYHNVYRVNEAEDYWGAIANGEQPTKEMLQYNIDPDTVISGHSLFEWALMGGPESEIFRLLEMGPELNVQGEDIRGHGRHPLHYAVERRNPRIVEAMIERGANVNLVNRRGATPLHYAVRDDNPEVIGVVLKHTTNVNARNLDGYTPLHYAVIYRQPKNAVLLLRSGADLNARETLSRGTPLHYACAKGLEEVVLVLLNAGADTTAIDVSGYSPIDIARKNGHHQIADFVSNYSPVFSK